MIRRKTGHQCINGDPRFTLFFSTITQSSNFLGAVRVPQVSFHQTPGERTLNRCIVSKEAGFHKAIFVPLSPALRFHPKFEVAGARFEDVASH